MSKFTSLYWLYLHLAKTEVQKTLSLVSCSVVKRSFRKPSKPDCVVFRTFMSLIPLWITAASEEMHSNGVQNYLQSSGRFGAGFHYKQAGAAPNSTSLILAFSSLPDAASAWLE